MKITWKYNKETEINNLIFTAGLIARRLPQNSGFTLLERIEDANFLNRNIVFPYKKLSSEVWQKLCAIEINVGEEIPDGDLLNAFKSAYDDLGKIDKQTIDRLEKEWQEIEAEFLEKMRQIFGELEFEEIVLFPTLYGMQGSYKQSGKILFIQSRIDNFIKHFIQSIIWNIVQQRTNTPPQDKIEKENLWHIQEEKRRLANFLSNKTTFSKFYTKDKEYDAENSPMYNPKVARKSLEYYTKLGFPSEKPLVLNNEKIILFSKNLNNLTKGQKEILKRLLEKEGKLINFEEIGNLLWEDKYYEKFSLNAITRMIYKLRQKLKEAGLQKEVIFTKRGQGYVLIQ